MKKNTIDLITLGCSKNLVDSEELIGRLNACGYQVAHDSDNPEGEIAIINTCGFIEAAKEESINMILEFAQAKKDGRLKKLLVMGCLSQRYRSDLAKEIPQVDKFYGKFDWKDVIADLGKTYDERKKIERSLTTPSHYAYLKISEGCDRMCTYCAIPLMTGHHVSRPIEDILEEVNDLVSKGVKEFQVIAQELTYYGLDLYHKQSIAELVERISDIPGVEWIRLHYAYPADFPMDLLRVIRERDNVCKYLDIALQHCSDHILSQMHRHVTKQQTIDLINEIRRQVPDIHIRTTLMVGYPGETEDDFAQLKDFVKEMHFERMGAFAYSEEDGTYAALHHKDDVPDNIKQKRLDVIMKIQESISADVNDAKVGKVLKVIIDRIEGEYYVGRTQFDSPEVDPEVLIKAEEQKLNIGDFYDAKIVSFDDYDLYATTLL